jgi:hypothetical protein
VVFFCQTAPRNEAKRHGGKYGDPKGPHRARATCSKDYDFNGNNPKEDLMSSNLQVSFRFATQHPSSPSFPHDHPTRRPQACKFDEVVIPTIRSVMKLSQ